MAPPSNTRWIETADAVRNALKEAPWGKKSAVVERYAKATGHHPHSLRRDVMALDAIVRFEVEDPAFAEQLRRLGSNSVLTLARLYPGEPEEARAAAADAVRGTLTVRALNARKPRVGRSPRRDQLREQTLRFAVAIGFSAGNIGETLVERDGALYLAVNDDSDTCVGYLPLSGKEPKQRQLHDAIALAVLHRCVCLGLDLSKLPIEWQAATSALQRTPNEMTIFGTTDLRSWRPILGRNP